MQKIKKEWERRKRKLKKENAGLAEENYIKKGVSEYVA
jgi:hypothetical protein